MRLLRICEVLLRRGGVALAPFAGRIGISSAGLSRRSAEGEPHPLPTKSPAGIQLSTFEIALIVKAICERPHCAFLVFGCGHDSSLWEQVNAGGTTAFLEHDPQWAQAAEARLRTARVFLVRYDTRVEDWKIWLDGGNELAMHLPEDIASRRWNVILVDGPPGYEPDHPGRMQSIEAASHLVAVGGCVFVHDCERPVEAAFAARYLGNHRIVAEARGRGLLRQYAF